MRKTFRSLMAMAIAMITLAACSDSDDDKYVADVSLPATVSTTQEGYILVEAGASEFTFDIKTDGQWTVTSQNRFLHVKNGQGTGNATVTVAVENNTFEDRKLGTLDIAFPGHEELNRSLTVEQKYLGDYGGNAADIIETTNKIYAVGYSYDITGEWASPNSVKVEIFDTKQLIADGIEGVNAAQVELSDYTVTGSTISEVSNKLTVKASVEGSYGAFKGEANASFDMETSESSTYEYASTYFDVQKRRASLNKSPQSLIFDYMTDDAYNAINGLPVQTKRGKRNLYPNTPEGFKRLISDFGTHVIVEAGLGGRLRRSLQVNTSEITTSYDVKAFAKASYDGIVKAEASVDEHFKQSYKDNSKAIRLSMSVLGGDEALATKLGAEKTFTAENYEAWKESVTTDNMALVNFSSSSLVPLYELVDIEAEGGEDRYNALKSYMTDGSVAADFSTYKCGTVTEFTVPSFTDAKYNSTLIKDIYLGGQWVGQVCNEFIPNINRDQRVTVVYPVVNNKARYNMGFFLGDSTHKPARVSWSGTNVSVEAYEDLDYGTATTVYLRGASVLPALPEGTTALKADDPRDEYLEMSDWNYPLVKIFNNVWMRELYHSGNTSGWSIWDYDIDVNGEKFTVKYQNFDSENDKYANFPAGWRVPTKDDAQDIIDKLSNNGFAQPITAMLYGGVTGFEEVLSYAIGSWWVYYMLTNEKSLQFSLYNGTVQVSDTKGTFPVRLVKK
ncbi:MAG: hypothetical protein IKU49_04110 [Prevotella sp.]|nr:hypothetical protein [Prevotella sp.]